MKQLLLVLLLATTTHVVAQENTSKVNYSPDIDGTIRGKYEYNSSLDGHRFQVRNARFSVRGAVSPYAFYKAEIDLSDEGVTKMLDAYVEMRPNKQFSFTIGQQKVPFSSDNLRSPHTLFFANRSFIGKQLTGLRDVGATIKYSLDKNIPLDLILGVYNGKGLYNQKEWRRDLSYAFRGVYSLNDHFELSLNYNTIKPYDLRMYMYNAGARWLVGKLHLESEFFYKTYQDELFQDTQGFFCFASYSIPTPKLSFVEDISPRIRYDMMSDDNNGIIDATSQTYLVDDRARSRITGGFTFTLKKPFINEIRLNYEHYMYANAVNEDDKVVIEFVAKF